MQYNLGVRVHYYVMIDFDGFRKLIDTVGGVDIDVPTTLDDYEYPTENYGTMRVHIPAGPAELRRLREKYPEQDLMLVGHEPDLSGTIGALTGGRVKMSKAAVALVELESGVSGGRLRWLFPPQFACA